MYESLRTDESLLDSLRADNIEDVKRIKLRESIDKALRMNSEPPMEFMNRLLKDQGLADFVVSQFFNRLMGALKEIVTEKFVEIGNEESIAAEPKLLIDN